MERRLSSILLSGVYYGLNAVGASIWNLLQQPRTVSEIRDAILGEYEAEPQQCERDLLTLSLDAFKMHPQIL